MTRAQNDVLAECYGKQAFPSPTIAQQVTNSGNRRSKVKLNTYKCPSCGQYHIGARSTK